MSANSSKFLKDIAEAMQVLHDCRDYLSGEVDIEDGDYGHPRANKAMQLTTAIEELTDQDHDIAWRANEIIENAKQFNARLTVALERAERVLAKIQYPDPVPPSNDWISETRRLLIAEIENIKGR